jgi:hypothetical protein
LDLHPPVLKVHLDLEAPLVQQVLQVHQVLLELKALKARKVHKGLQAQQDLQVVPARPVLQVHVDHKAVPADKVLLALQAPKVQQVRRVLQVPKVQQALPVELDLQVLSGAHKARLGHLDQVARKAPKVQLAPKARKGYRVLLKKYQPVFLTNVLKLASTRLLIAWSS